MLYWVTRALGVAPTFAARKGDQRTVAGHEVTQRTGVWVLEFGGAPEEWSLDDAIDRLLMLLPGDLRVWERLAAAHRLDVFCALHLKCRNRGVTLSPELLRCLADRHLELGLDIYYVGPDSPP
jgi:hypothetical protein